MSIIELLNESCSHCHRKEYSQKIFAMLAEFRGHLKNLAIGKKPIRISYWFQHLEIRKKIVMQKIRLASTTVSRNQNYWPTTTSFTSCFTIFRTEKPFCSITPVWFLLSKNWK